MSDDRLAEIKKRADVALRNPYRHNEDIPWLIAEIERLRVALAAAERERDVLWETVGLANVRRLEAELVAVRAALEDYYDNPSNPDVQRRVRALLRG